MEPEGPLAGESALAHGHPLKDTAHGLQCHIVPPVDEEAVEIQRLLPHAAGAVALAGLLVCLQHLRRQSGVASFTGVNIVCPSKVRKAVGERTPPLLCMKSYLPSVS